MTKRKIKRRIKLIQPRLQLRMIAVFAGVALTSLLLQFLLFAQMLSRLAVRLPNDALIVLSELRGELISVLFVSLVVLLPLMFAIGVLVTFRVAGPVYRLETYLGQVAAGERPADCRLRKGDELMDLCAAVNEATRPLREGGASTRGDGGAVVERRPAA